ncbi:hypothetical protein Gogos_015053 [Gossypium gossypioides]|uniref:DUF8204 domain-containing protein n=1 Tax=Gossypium gossypioides TaxID=34282 RepID=A0A7J9C0J9_GOSGO|nr:hypothetical protein [Gossypium gossypioides]
MERNREEERKQNLEKENKEGNENENENGTVKSCKGFLFYSSALKSHNRDPLCIGIPRSLFLSTFIIFQFYIYIVSRKEYIYSALILKSHNVGLAEVKAHRNSAVVEDFSFVCAGYSLFMSKNEGSITKDGTKPQLPHCRGLAVAISLSPFSMKFALNSSTMPLCLCIRSLAQTDITMVSVSAAFSASIPILLQLLLMFIAKEVSKNFCCIIYQTVEPLRSQFPVVVPLFVLTNFWLFLFSEDHGVHQHQTRKSTYAVEDDFLNRQADDLTC